MRSLCAAMRMDQVRMRHNLLRKETKVSETPGNEIRVFVDMLMTFIVNSQTVVLCMGVLSI